MSKAGKRLIGAAKEALAVARGEMPAASFRVHVPERINVKAIRNRLGLTQAEFCRRFGLSLDTLRKWEQKGREPEGPARAYLKVIAHNPKAVEEALRA